MIIPKRKSHLAFNRLQDQLIIIDFKAEHQFHQLNDVAGRIWELCDGKNSQTQIIDQMLSEFEIDRDIIEKDVEIFLSELKQNALLDF